MDDNVPEYTPLYKHRSGIILKREDAYRVAGVCGAKVRVAETLIRHARDAGVGVVGYGGRTSAQMQIVARVAQSYGVPARIHTASGADTPEIKDAITHGAEVVRHFPGYMTVLAKRAATDAGLYSTGGILPKREGWNIIPYGMRCEYAVEHAKKQMLEAHHRGAILLKQGPGEGLRGRRIVIVLGGGANCAGILQALASIGYPEKVIGVKVGGDPTPGLDDYAPKNWRSMLDIVETGIPYEKPVDAKIGDVELDPYYEAKAVPFLREGDLFWIIGKRTTP